jgi:hypothetical protein
MSEISEAYEELAERVGTALRLAMILGGAACISPLSRNDRTEDDGMSQSVDSI